jgi:hypothetical protein
MLSVLRRNAGSWAIKIILTFIALTFIWWGVGTYSEQGRNVAATVGGEAITTNELAGRCTESPSRRRWPRRST